MKRLFVVAYALLAAACASVTPDTTLSASSTTGIVIVASDDVRNSQTHLYAFQRVDLASRTFVDGRFSVFFGTFGTPLNDELKVPAAAKTSLRFAAHPAPAGDYILISKTTALNNNGTEVCFSLGTAVYHVSAGTVNLTPIGVPREADVKGEAAQVLAGYPNISAPIALTEIVGSAEFDGGKGPLGNKRCVPKGTFTFRARPA